MAYFATEYTIHFDDTMAYGSHHFLTAFKLQCHSRESFLFGERIFDVAGVRAALDGVHLLTADAYARNLHPAKLGDRLVILLSLEDWGRVSARFCYRVLNEQGISVCAGFQTLICADATTQLPIPLPKPLQQAMNAMREIEEVAVGVSFRDRVLAGGSQLESLFGTDVSELARQYLSQRYPSPQIVVTLSNSKQEAVTENCVVDSSADMPNCEPQAWVFAGQAAYDAQLLSERVLAIKKLDTAASQELSQCAEIAAELIGGNAQALVSGSPERCRQAVTATPTLSQVAIHLQNVLGARLWQARGHQPRVLMGHSFGEIAALGVAGCFDLPTGVRIVCSRMRCIAEHAPADGGLLVVSSHRSVVETEAALLGLQHIVVAGRNHDAQTVLSGPKQQLNQLKEQLHRIGIGATNIDSPTSFHHPQLRQVAAHWYKELQKLQLKSPIRDVYSAIGRRYIAASDEIAAVLAGQLLRPFDLQGGIADVFNDGVTHFVDCGSAGMLSKLLTRAGLSQIEVSCVADQPLLGETETTASAPLVLAPTPTEPIGESAITPDRQTARANDNDLRIAIVGQGCILPGGASSPEQLFAAIAERRSGIVDQRHYDPHWSTEFYAERLTPDRSNSHLTGRVNDSDIAVPKNVDAEVFERFTRTQKLLCIALAPCLEGLAGAERVLCLIGATADGFEDQDVVSSLRFAGIDPADCDVDLKLQSARSAGQTPHSAVQEVFDHLVRPGLKITLVDAACASSLYSLALGMQALQTHKADAVIAGGVFCPGPGNSCLFSQFRGTTSTGCRPFDVNADGVVFSEGAALVTLRRLSDAERLGLAIDATVVGAGLSSDGKSSSANVPQTRGQLLSLERCYANYQIDPSSITAIEAHGTSTPVGDSTELETLRQFFSSHASQPIPVHSLKGLLGHAGWAAGTASVIAACQYMRQGQFPAQATYREPSATLKKCQATLAVSTSPIALPAQQRRIAIDGFGFGGANAHVVVAQYERTNASSTSFKQMHSEGATPETELVFVAYHQERPTLQTEQGSRFDRTGVRLSRKHIVLPELADDMDISQTLTVDVSEQVLAQLPQFDADLRRETSLVLAMSGKSERGIEATLRIMTPRLRRVLQGNAAALQALDMAYHRARPSGAYTLQCMMPNVAAGRAALLLNLNGPNFVVDAGAHSLEAALSAAALLLLGGKDAGSKLVVIAAVDASSDSLPVTSENASPSEFAAAFAVTTRRLAETRGMKIIASVDAMCESIRTGAQDKSQKSLPAAQLNALLASLELASDGKSLRATPAVLPPTVVKQEMRSNEGEVEGEVADEVEMEDEVEAGSCGIYVPVWVEKDRRQRSSEIKIDSLKSLLLVVPAHFPGLVELAQAANELSERLMIAVVASTAIDNAFCEVEAQLVRVDMSRARDIADALRQIEAFKPTTVAVIDKVCEWQRGDVLAKLAGDNSLCEFLFLIGQAGVERLRQHSLDLWGVLLDAWNGDVHPSSGPLAGLLKSIQREFPTARTGTICTRGLDVSAALRCLCDERMAGDGEQEIAFDRETRLVRRLRPAAINRTSSPQVELNSRSVVVASGGAKGVTAVMIEAILRDYGCTVIALGRSSLEVGPDKLNDVEVEQEFYKRFLRDNPGTNAAEMKKHFESARAGWEAQRTIQQLSKLGGRIEYQVADVTDHEQLEQVIDQIVTRYGSIDLLIHGAGVQKSKRLSDRSLADFRQTFAIKVVGLHNLVDCCRSRLGRTVSAHVLSSAYSVFGNDGQHDYGAANETLDRICSLSDGEDVRWSSIAWLAWDAVGMTRGSEYRALAKQRRLSGITPALGKRLFRQVLAGQTGGAINVPMSSAEHVEYAVKTIPCSTVCKSKRILEASVRLSDIDCLPFHKVRNTPTLPGAWILDLLVQAGLQVTIDSEVATSVTVQDLSFARFVRLANRQEPNVRVVAEQSGKSIAVWMIADILHPSGLTLSKDVVCASAVLSFSDEELNSATAGGGLSAAPRRGHFVRDPYCLADRSVALSGMFDCLSEIEIGTENRRASFRPNGNHELRGEIPALLLDAAWRVGAMYAVAGHDDVFVPVKIGRMVLPLRIFTQTGSASTWEIRSSRPRSDDREVRWDRTEVFDQTGLLKLVVEDALATQLH